MLAEKLKHLSIILASGSPRRQQFFKDLGIDFEVKLKPVEEQYPDNLKHTDIAVYLAKLKARAFKKELGKNELLVTSDTIVWYNEQALGKPTNVEQAYEMIKSLSNNSHEVITAVCFTNCVKQKTIHSTTKVWFKDLSDEEIKHYINTYQPYDKAGAYGIQEWIGLIGITKIEGSYFNVMGLPTDMVYQTFLEFT
ncbi:Maf-like protein [Leptobacterium sp. I13]|uniref:Maf-like protein n=1 Tax=Leptobacterium meishanense TaxID=3128904 RepID=UPI0030EED760